MEQDKLPLYLNEDMQTVQEYCGDTVMWELLKTVPGITIFIPMREKFDDNFALGLLSDTTRKALVENFGGQRIYVPTRRKAIEQANRIAAVKLRSKGKMVQEIALMLGMSENSILSYLSEAGKKDDTRQSDFFDRLHPTTVG